MPSTSTKHRPLFSGLRIESQRPETPTLGPGEGFEVAAGTLSGVATRDSDGAQVLVTNLHVLAGFSVPSAGNPGSRRLLNAGGDEEMFQDGLTPAYKVEPTTVR